MKPVVRTRWREVVAVSIPAMNVDGEPMRIDVRDLVARVGGETPAIRYGVGWLGADHLRAIADFLDANGASDE